MEVTTPISNVIHFKSDNQYEISMTFMRMQEFYESPIKDIRNEYFTLEQYMDRYAELSGNFTYTLDWAGFNIPGDVVSRFFAVFYPDLTMKESRLHGQLRRSINEYLKYETKFYVIGTYKNSDVAHELAHALFYLNDSYREKMENLVKSIPSIEYNRLSKKLIKMGYDTSVIDDEIQAYLSTPGIEFRENMLYGEAFKLVYNKYMREV